MTREEAIILIERAANELREMMKTITMPTSAAEQLKQEIDAHEIAISALRREKTVTERHDLTNAQKIRAMSDEELALWICGVYDIEEEHGKFINGIIIPGYAPHDIEEWLQQPCEDDDHA